MSSTKYFYVFQDVLRTPCQDVLKTSSGRLEDVLEDVKLLHWRRLEDVVKTCVGDVLKTCLQDVLNIICRKKNIYWGYLYTYLGITNINVYISRLFLNISLYFANLYLTMVTRIQNILIRIQQIHYSPYFGTQAASLF